MKKTISTISLAVLGMSAALALNNPIFALDDNNSIAANGSVIPDNQAVSANNKGVISVNQNNSDNKKQISDNQTIKPKKQPDNLSFKRFGTYRADFMSFTNRDIAASCVIENSDSYAPLKWTINAPGSYTCPIKLSLMQMDRDVFLRLASISGPFELYVNDSLSGTCMQSKGSAEMLLDPFTREGDNTLTIKLIPPTTQAKSIGITSQQTPPKHTYLTWQPMVHIEDFSVAATLDSALMQKGVLSLEIAMINSFNGVSGPLQVWYELENADGTLIDYSYKEMELEPMSRDTARFTKVLKTINPWNHDSPYLYKLVLKVRQKNHFTEYSALRVGFRSVSTDPLGLLLNGKPLKIKGIALPHSADTWSVKELEKELSTYKKLGVNLLSVSAPMPYFFYEATDKKGLYVIQMAQLNTLTAAICNLKEGDPNNAPELLPLFLDQIEKMYQNNKNRTSIIAWNIGNGRSNGYNNQHSYLKIKELENYRPALYTPAMQSNQWNTDLSGHQIELLTPEEAVAKWGKKEEQSKKNKKSNKI